MKRLTASTSIKALFAGCLLLLASAPARAALEPFAIYEDWTTSDFIRSDRWSQSTDNISHDARAEVQGHLKLRFRRQASAATDTGVAFFSNRLAFVNPTAIDGIQAVFLVRSVTVQRCPANPTPAQARAAAIDIVKFSDLDPSVSRVPGSFTGDYFARVQAARASDATDPPDTLIVTAVLFRCNNAACTDSTTIQTAPLGQAAIGHQFQVRLVWDSDANEFRAGLDGGPDVSLPYGALNRRVPNVPFGSVRIQHRMPNCTPAGGGPIEVDTETEATTIETNASAVIP